MDKKISILYVYVFKQKSFFKVYIRDYLIRNKWAFGSASFNLFSYYHCKIGQKSIILYLIHLNKWNGNEKENESIEQYLRL